MKIIMNTKHINSINDIKEFLQGTRKVEIKVVSRSEKYHFISNTLVKLRYRQLKRPDRALKKVFNKNY